MTNNRRSKLTFMGLSLATALLALLFLAPFYLVFVNSLKTYGDVLKNAAGFPKQPVFENYAIAWEKVQFPIAFFNSFVITVLSITLLVLFGAMAAWRLARSSHQLNRVIFIVFVAAMVIPFQAVMIPMMKVTSNLNLLNSRLGLVTIYLSFGMPFTIFLFHGFVRTSVPKEIEEAAVLDGCSSLQTFFAWCCRFCVPWWLRW